MITINDDTPETAISCLNKLLKAYPEHKKLIKKQIKIIHSVIEIGEAYQDNGTSSITLLIDIENIECLLRKKLV
jgi:hypothetical protein